MKAILTVKCFSCAGCKHEFCTRCALYLWLTSYTSANPAGAITMPALLSPNHLLRGASRHELDKGAAPLEQPLAVVLHDVPGGLLRLRRLRGPGTELRCGAGAHMLPMGLTRTERCARWCRPTAPSSTRDKITYFYFWLHHRQPDNAHIGADPLHHAHRTVLTLAPTCCTM